MPNTLLQRVERSQRIKKWIAELDFKETRTGTLKRQQFYCKLVRRAAQKHGWLSLRSRMDRLETKLQGAQSKADHYKYKIYRRPFKSRYVKFPDRWEKRDGVECHIIVNQFHFVRGVTQKQIYLQRPANKKLHDYWLNKVEMITAELVINNRLELQLKDKIYAEIMRKDIKVNMEGEYYVPRR